MKIGKPVVTHEDDEVFYRVNVEGPGMPAQLWYSVPEYFGDLVTNRADAAFVALLIPAMNTAGSLRVEGTLSERLYLQACRPLQFVLCNLIPRLKPLDVSLAGIALDTMPASGVATGFSGGIDSWCTINDHLLGAVSSNLRLSHLLFNNVGSHSAGGERLFRDRYTRLLQATEEFEVPLIPVNSNLDTFYGNRFAFQETHTLRNAFVGLMLQHGIGSFLYSSTYTYLDSRIAPTYDIAYGDPFTLPLISTPTMSAVAVGGEYTRVEKTIRVAGMPVARKHLDVCIDESGGGNCSKCFKCLRTLLTLEVAGLLEEFGDCFDLTVYRQHRVGYIAAVLASRGCLERERLRFADERRFAIPIASYLRALPMLPRSIAKSSYRVRQLARSKPRRAR